MDALDFLRNLVNLPLCYGLKSSDMDLYDFGFGNMVNVMNWYGEERELCPYILHVTCRFKVICKNGDYHINKYYEDTSSEKFCSDIKSLVGLKVRQVALSDKNDLWLDFGDYWIVFVTFENGEESWRFFTSDIQMPHLVASDSWLYFS